MKELLLSYFNVPLKKNRQWDELICGCFPHLHIYNIYDHVRFSAPDNETPKTKCTKWRACKSTKSIRCFFQSWRTWLMTVLLGREYLSLNLLVCTHNNDSFVTEDITQKLTFGGEIMKASKSLYLIVKSMLRKYIRCH